MEAMLNDDTHDSEERHTREYLVAGVAVLQIDAKDSSELNLLEPDV